MDRRSFLRHLLMLPIAAQLDVERLLWVPKPLVVVPAMPAISRGISLDEINEVCRQIIMPRVIDDFFRSPSFLMELSR
jgi:hypothetical protein